jgi:hypothetical protein
MEENDILYTFITVSNVHSSLDFGFKNHHFFTDQETRTFKRQLFSGHSVLFKLIQS